MTPRRASSGEICEWCRDHAALILARPRDLIDPDSKLTRLGLDSATSVHLMVALEEWLGVDLEPELAFEYPTLRALSDRVAEILASHVG